MSILEKLKKFVRDQAVAEDPFMGFFVTDVDVDDEGNTIRATPERAESIMLADPDVFRGAFDAMELSAASDVVARIQEFVDNKSIDYATRAVMQHFVYAHLGRDDLRELSRTFAVQALHVYDTCPSNPDRTLALRDLVTAKDNAIRAKLYRLKVSV